MYAVLIVYASLYPFADWRNQGIEPWAFIATPISRYWTGFDVGVNIVGYVPLGGLLALGMLRSRRSPHPLLWSVCAGALLAMAMETLQSYLPARVPSREDFLLNTFGAGLGALCAAVLERMGAIDRWSQVRRRWFVENSRGGMVLLVTWPLALLFPASVPFGLGQVLVRAEHALAGVLQDTPFLEWIAIDTLGLEPLMPATESFCVLLGVLIPCLLGFCIVRSPLRRIVLVLAVLTVGVATTTLSSALSWGPTHAWAWLDLPSQIGMAGAALVALLLVAVPWRVSAALILLALGVYLSLLNQAPDNPYFAQTLQDWEQGRFIRFNGLSQWVGWLWPYATLGYVMTQIWQRETEN